MLNPLAHSPQYHVLAIALGADELPTEFRLFESGRIGNLNDITATFDAKAAELTMAKYRASGTRVQIDLEHDSLVKSTEAVRPDMRDARGWCDLEVRSGELWAVNVEWTPDGARRLKEKTQRYVSPAFTTDAEGRVDWLVNVALCARPATLGALPLVASQSTEPKKPMAKKIKKLNMDPDLAAKAAKIVEDADEKGALDLVKEMLVSAAAGGAAPADEPPPEAATADALEDEKKDELVAAAVQAATAAVSQTTELVRSLQTSVQTLTAERTAAESVERASLVGRLVELRAETPATAYVGDAKDQLCARLASEPIAELRTRVTELAKSAPPSVLKQPTTPSETRVRTFTPAQLAEAAKRGMTPEQLAARVESAVRTVQ